MGTIKRTHSYIDKKGGEEGKCDTKTWWVFRYEVDFKKGRRMVLKVKRDISSWECS